MLNESRAQTINKILEQNPMFFLESNEYFKCLSVISRDLREQRLDNIFICIFYQQIKEFPVLLLLPLYDKINFYHLWEMQIYPSIIISQPHPRSLSHHYAQVQWLISGYNGDGDCAKREQRSLGQPQWSLGSPCATPSSGGSGSPYGPTGRSSYNSDIIKFASCCILQKTFWFEN